MAEALGVAGSIVGIVSLGIQISGGVLNYYEDWKDRDTEILRMYQATDDLCHIFMSLRVTLNKNTFEPDIFEVVQKSIMSCESGVLKLEQRLRKLRKQGGLGLPGKLYDQVRRALYPFRAKSLVKLSAIVNELRNNLGLALGALQIRTSLAFLDQSEKAVTVLSQVDSTTLLLSKAQISLELEKIEKRRKEVITWISHMDFAAKQYEAISARQEGTGNWVLENPVFQSWTRDADGKRILWCPGIPGAGKTVLAATIVDHLQWNFQSSQVAVTYIYCDYRLQREQTLITLLASLLSQLVDAKCTIPEAIHKSYVLHQSRKTRPTLKEYLNLLHIVISQFSLVFIVIDALDECEEDLRTRFVKNVRSLHENARVLCTSRFLPDIMAAFEDVKPWLEITASESDMKKYILGRIEQVVRLQRHVRAEEGLLEEIETRIIQLAEGMFLIAKLHLDGLAKMQTRKAIRTALMTLPMGINETYDSIMSRIDAQEDEDALLARRALAWISYTLRPLAISELQQAAQIQILDAEDKDIGEDDLPDPHTILAVCAGLVIIDGESGIVRLAHPSTQEYFERRRPDIFPDAHHRITISCMRYLTLPAISARLATIFLIAITDSAAQVRTEIANLTRRYPFLFYASTEWRNHAKRHTSEILNGRSDLDDYWEQLLKQPLQVGSMSNAASVQYVDNIGIMLLVRSTDIDQTDLRQQWIAMSWSSYSEQLTTIPFQMSKDFLAGKQTFGAPLTPLLKSLKSSHLLLEAPISHVRVPKWTVQTTTDITWRLVRSIIHGADAAHASLLKVLLLNGAELKSNRMEETDYLWEAVANFGDIGIAEMLISQGRLANSRGYRGQTPLFHAAACGHSEMIDFLVINGADVNATDRSNRTPIFQAALFGHPSVIDRLVANGAEVDAIDINGCTALCYIAKAETRKPNLEVVRRMLAHNASPNTKDNSGSSPLAYASSTGEMILAELLVASGADVDITLLKGPTGLTYAISRGKMELAKRLLANSRDDSKDIFDGPSLLLNAILKRDKSLVESVLTSTKVNIDTCPRFLEFALISRDQDIFESLLLLRPDINAFSWNGASSLIWAVMLGEEKMVELLLKSGANVYAETSDSLTPLILAIATGQRNIVKALLAYGADRHSEACDGSIPLDCILGENSINWEGHITRWCEEQHKIQQLETDHRGIA